MIKTYLYSVFMIFLISVNANADCYDDAAHKYNIDPNILRAITLVESSGSQFALNIGGKAYFPANYEDAAIILQRLRNKRVTFDIGVQQINKFWLDKFYEGNYHYALDACFNIELSAAIIDYERSICNDTWDAVGRYHSKTPSLKFRYMSRVITAFKKLNN